MAIKRINDEVSGLMVLKLILVNDGFKINLNE